MCSSDLDRRLKAAYQDLWKTVLLLPSPVASLFFNLELELPAVYAAVNRMLLRSSIPAASRFLAEYRPDVVVSTHWGCTHLLQAARRDGRPPILNIHGEIGGVFSMANCGADLYFALSDEAAAGLESVGVQRSRIRRIPFIIHPDMADRGIPRAEAKRALGIPEDRLTVVFSMGGDGIGPSMRFLDAFRRSGLPATIVVLAGRSVGLLEQARRREDGKSVIAFGYLQDIGGILAAADLLAGKSGTSFVTMAVKRGIPLIVTRIGAPNERDNVGYLLDRGYGWLCRRPRRFVGLLRRLIAEPELREEAARRLELVDRANGAEAIASAAVELVSQEKEASCAPS